ncbi:MAG: hypothetical protein E7434_02880 [Ruminococcaceae bacterium]|nr:hypothetical protein [Oscillospiraceae bacterium]
MNEQELWVSFSWYCPNCGKIVVGYKDSNGTIKVQCRHCETTMIRRIKGRRHDTIDLYAPRNQEQLQTG